MIALIGSIVVAYLTSTSTATPEQSINTPKSVNTNKRLRTNKVLRKLVNIEQETDISNYSIIYEKCQYVENFLDDQVAEGNSTVVTVEPFVVFRLCPSGLNSCHENYEERKMDIDEYLQIIVGYKQEEQEDMCMMCEANCEVGDVFRKRHLWFHFSRQLNIDCDSCIDECEKIEEMEENGYIDATNFIGCQKIVDDDDYPLYAGPMCGGHQGSKMKIGVFVDADCMLLDTSKVVEEYLGDEHGHAFKLSYALLKQTYDKTEPITCKDINEEEEIYNEFENAAVIEANEVCTNLCEAATRYGKIHLN